MIDEKTIAMIDEVIHEAGQSMSRAEVVSMTDEEIDELVPPLTIDEHRMHFRMYLSILSYLVKNLDLQSESTWETLQIARDMRSPASLAAMAELLQQKAWMDLLPALVGSEKAKDMCRGRRSVPHPVTNAIAAYLKENPTATAKHIWRVADEWLPEDAWLEDDEINFTVNGNERKVNFDSFKKLVTNAKKMTDR